MKTKFHNSGKIENAINCTCKWFGLKCYLSNKAVPKFGTADTQKSIRTISKMYSVQACIGYMLYASYISHFSFVVKDHDQGNLYKKGFIWDLPFQRGKSSSPS